MSTHSSDVSSFGDDSGYPADFSGSSKSAASASSTDSSSDLAPSQKKKPESTRASSATPFVTVVSISVSELRSILPSDVVMTNSLDARSRGGGRKSSSSSSGPHTTSATTSSTAGGRCGKIMVASRASSASSLVRRASSNSRPDGFVTVLEIGGKTAERLQQRRKNSLISRTPSLSSSHERPSGPVTVQIKTNKVRRSSSVSSDNSIVGVRLPQRAKDDKAIHTLPCRRSSSESSSSTTVRNLSSVEEDIVIYRLPGEKLGLGLRFDGGSKANEFVNRLFVQCCSKGSPSTRTKCTWGTLSDGDEILSISSRLVKRMTRLDCVKALKESPVSVKMRIRHYFSHLSINASASYDVRQGFDKLQCDFIDSDALFVSDQRRCQTLAQPPRKPTRSTLSQQHLKTSGSRSSSVPAIAPSFNESQQQQAPGRNRSSAGGTKIHNRTASAEISPTSSVTGTTRAIIERTRSSRSTNFENHQKAATLPRGGIFVKAKNAGKHKAAISKSSPDSASEELGEAFVDSDEILQTQTLPRSYKSATMKKSPNEPQQRLSRTQSASVLNNGVNLVVTSDSFVSSTLPRSKGNNKLVLPVLTVQEKMAMDLPSLPPQAEVYVNLLEGESVDDEDDETAPKKSPPLEEISSKLISPLTLIDESDNSSISTLSTVQSKRTTPSSSFTAFDAKKNKFDLAKLLDPFEQLEREFNWEELTPIRPPSAFSSFLDIKDEASEGRDDSKECNGRRCSTEQQKNIEKSLQCMEAGSYKTLDRRSRRDLFDVESGSSSSAGKEDRRSSSTAANMMEGLLVTNHRHTLSQDCGSHQPPPPPTISRLPPDGHEFPPDYRDPSSIPYQNSEILSRKSSASSTGSLDRSSSYVIKSRPLMRHDQQSACSVKAKIALFSSAAADNNSVASNSLTRSLTHNDVRFEENGTSRTSPTAAGAVKSMTAYRSMVNVSTSKDLTSSTDSLVRATHARLMRLSSEANTSRDKKPTPSFGSSRSQSLMEIAPKGYRSNAVSHERSISTSSAALRSLSSSGLSKSVDNNSSVGGESRRKSAMTKTKSPVIPEMEAASSSKVLSTPPWKTNGLPKYSPAFKRKPFTVHVADSKPVAMNNTKSDDSDNDSAVSSGRSSLSHISVSPPNSPRSVGKRPLNETIEETSEVDNPRVLKKDSIEAINRRNILESCKKSSAKPELKPASRSSSFTIAERKKSFEMMNAPRALGESSKIHSSQDSLANSSPNSRKTSCDSAFNSRRPSKEIPPTEDLGLRRGSENFADTIKDIENRVARMSEIVERNLDKKGQTMEQLPKSKVEAERPKELIFGPRKSSSVSSGSPGVAKSIRELAEKWESRSSLTSEAIVASPGSRSQATDKVTEWSNFLPADAAEWESFDLSMPSSSPSNSMISPDRKYSVPDSSSTASSGVKMRENKNAAPSRPSSLIESGPGTELKIFEIGLSHGGRIGISASTSRGSSQADLLDCSTTSDTPKSPGSRDLLDSLDGRTPTSEAHSLNNPTLANGNGGRRCVSVNDIRRAFEKAEQSLQMAGGMSPCHHRMSSLDSTNSDESSIPTPQLCYGSVSSLISGQNSSMRDHYGSISSLASSTSLISPQELQGLIDEANQSLEESGTPSHEIMVIVLHREFTAGSIGITLAGGADYENKDITVHKVIPGTLADRDGRIQKGDRVLSINGRSTKGVTHREALSILKAPRSEVVLVLSRSRSVTPADGAYDRADYPSYNYINSGRPPKILESPLDSKSLLSDLKFVDVPRGAPKTVVLKKEGTGLGFSLEGGKDSPLGDRPLTIKKIFTGGAADKTNVLRVGDEIVMVNNTDCSRMSRIEAWNFMKKLNDGTATLVIRQKLIPDAEKPNCSGSTSSNAGGSNNNDVGTKSNNANQDTMSCEQKEPEKLEAKR